MARIPVLFDTDIGSDIDDAVALAYLLKEPRCELLGITTVTGEPTVRAQLADAMCQAFGRTEVPIHSGTCDPLIVPLKQKEVHQRAALEKWPHRKQFPSNTAVEFLRETIRSRPGEITLLSVGPMTNIGLLFALDPEIPKLIKRWVMMGGIFVSRPPGYGVTEWNAIGDPHATHICFAARPKEAWCYGLDVTTQCLISAEDFRKRFAKGPLRVVGDMAEKWFEQRPIVTYHDPLAAVCVFEPDICQYETGLVTVELTSERLAGLTHFDRGANEKPHRVATKVDSGRLFKKYFEVVEG